ncbi:MAG: alkaline phosphatase family protein [Candidatus Hydrogenedens sp.]
MPAKNVLWIISDEFRADCLGYSGNSIIQTPHLDSLCKESAVFSNCFAQATPCAPSRMCMFTGRYMFSHGCLWNKTPLRHAKENLAFYLRRYNYDPTLIGYNDYAKDPEILPSNHPHRFSLSYEYALPGFNHLFQHEYDSPEWYVFLREKGYPQEQCTREYMCQPDVPTGGPQEHLPEYYPAHYKAEHSECRFITEKAIDYIHHQKDSSWFLSLNYIKPHSPNLCSDPYHKLYRNTTFPPPIRARLDYYQNDPYFKRLGKDACNALINPTHLQDFRSAYYGMITELDFNLGILFDYLKSHDLWNNTLIIFTSDHGEHLGDHFLTGKSHYFDGAYHVPLIIYDPSEQASSTRGQIIHDLVELIDIAPTICDYLNIPIYPLFQGNNLLPRIHNKIYSINRKAIFSEYYYYYHLTPEEQEKTDPEKCLLCVVRDTRYKCVFFGEDILPPRLFDISYSDGEINDLANDKRYHSLINYYLSLLLRWRIKNADWRMEQWARALRTYEE